MAIKATPVGEWVRDWIPPLAGNREDPDPVTCDVRALPQDIEAALSINSSAGAVDGSRGLRIPVDTQRAIVTQCCRNIRGYTGTHGQPLTTGAALLGPAAGREAAAFIIAVVSKVIELTWSPADRGESDAPRASS